MPATHSPADAPTIIAIDWMLSLSLEDIGHIGPVARTFALQNAVERAQERVEEAISAVERDMLASAPAGRQVDLTLAVNHPNVRDAQERVAQARQAASDAQEQIGGMAFCVANDKLAYAHKTIDALSRKAAKIDCEAITLTDTDEKVILHYQYADDAEAQRAYFANFEHTFVILKGSTPRIPGFEFIATVSVTEAGNLVKTVPALALATRKNLGGEERAQAWLDSLDLTRFRSTGDLCEHCNKHRARNDTFVVYNEETGETKQVGRTCLKDFTGTNNPERIVKVLQQVWEAMRTLSMKGETPAILTDEFLAHAAAIYRVEGGYRKGEHKWDTLRNIANQARRVHHKGQPQWVEPEAHDYDFARTVRGWALENLDNGDFGYNVKTAITPDVLNEKAAGYAAAVFAAWQRAQAIKVEKQAERESSFIGEMGQRGNFTLTVTDIAWRSGYAYDSESPTFTFEDGEGNRARWRASDMPRGGMKVGATYEVKASVKPAGQYPGHEDHAKYGKTTHLTRVSITKVVSEPEDN